MIRPHVRTAVMLIPGSLVEPMLTDERTKSVSASTWNRIDKISSPFLVLRAPNDAETTNKVNADFLGCSVQAVCNGTRQSVASVAAPMIEIG